MAGRLTRLCLPRGSRSRRALPLIVEVVAQTEGVDGHYPFDLATRPDGHRPLRAPAMPAAPAPKTLNRV